ncbi:hypothetical protein LZ31DRAFT_592146 [Colletotrichum somersetense]|nr:hypothetical protein LZ31DRAFT_592146 [Colletotrichum somersetense]
MRRADLWRCAYPPHIPAARVVFDRRPPYRAQTPQQRRANAKFAKDNESRMGKSEDQIKKRTKEAPKSPISPVWLGLLAFVIFGGIVFEAFSRMFGF